LSIAGILFGLSKFCVDGTVAWGWRRRLRGNPASKFIFPHAVLDFDSPNKIQAVASYYRLLAHKANLMKTHNNTPCEQG
jgi:hypothetical protein